MRDLTRTVIAAVVAAATMSMLLPVGAAASEMLTTIVDPNSDAKAQVDAGKLRVGDGAGALTVNGTVGALPPGRPFRLRFEDSSSDGDYIMNIPPYEVPAGKQLMITMVSGLGVLPAGQAFSEVYLLDGHDSLPDQSASHPSFHYIAPANYVEDGGERLFTFSQPVLFTVGPGQYFQFLAERSDNVGFGRITLFIDGFLADV